MIPKFMTGMDFLKELDRISLIQDQREKGYALKKLFNTIHHHYSAIIESMSSDFEHQANMDLILSELVKTRLLVTKLGCRTTETQGGSNV